MWISRKEQEPPTDHDLIVWGAVGHLSGDGRAIAVTHDMDWVDVVDFVDVDFEFWQLAPDAPF